MPPPAAQAAEPQRVEVETPAPAPAPSPAPAPEKPADRTDNSDIMNDPGFNDLLAKFPGATVVGVRRDGK